MNAPAPRSASVGLAQAVGAYLWWGFFPLYVTLLVPTGPVEMIAWRVLCSVLVCALAITVIRGWAKVRAVVVDRRAMLTLGAAGALIFVNWLVFLFAVSNGHVLEASLGYFLNPVFTVLLGVLLLRERLRPAQWAAVAISAVAVVVLVVGYGDFPWVALTLSTTFAIYGLIKKRLGGQVDAITGLAVETTWLTPLAGALLVWVAVAGGGLTIGGDGPGHVVLVLLLGPITAVPLVLFAAGARRLPLAVLGFTQYLAPILQLLVGMVLLHEPMPPERLAGFAIVWLALLVLSVDAIVASGRARRRMVVDPI